MGSRSPYYLEKKDLLEKLDQVGYPEIADILKDKEIDGEKLIKLRELDVICWGLTPVKRRILFSFIDKYKINPSMLQFRPRPDIATKGKNIFPIGRGKPTIPTKNNLNRIKLTEVQSGSGRLSPNTFPKVPCKIQMSKGSHTEPPVANLKTFQSNLTPTKKAVQTENEVKNMRPMKPIELGKNDPGYIDMTRQTLKPVIPNKLFTVKREGEQNTLNLRKEITSRSTSPSNFEKRAVDNEEIRKEPPRYLPKPPPLALIKPWVNSIANSTTITVPPEENTPTETVYEDMYVYGDACEKIPTEVKNKLEYLFNQTGATRIVDKKQTLGLPLHNVHNNDKMNLLPGGKSLWMKSPVADQEVVMRQTPSPFEDFPEDTTYETIPEMNKLNRPNTYLDLVAPSNSEDTNDESDSTNLYENLPNNGGNLVEDKKSSIFSKIFRRRYKDQQSTNSSTETLVNMSPSNTTKVIDYKPYKSRPLPEPPVEKPSAPSTHMRNDSIEKVSVKTVEIVTDTKKDDVCNVADRAQSQASENSSNPYKNSTKKPEILPVPKVSCLATQLKEKLEQMTSSSKSSRSATPDEFSSDDNSNNHSPVYVNKGKKPAFFYELAFINRKPASAQVPSEDVPSDDENDEIYVQAVSKITTDPFYRNISKSEAKQYLEDLQDGAFVFIPSSTGNYVLVMTVKYGNKYYYMRLGKSKHNRFKLVGQDEHFYPDFSTLTDFVDYFTKEPITINSEDGFIDILLKPVLPKNRFYRN